MESPKPNLINQNWFFFTLASFLGFLLLTLFHNQSHQLLTPSFLPTTNLSNTDQLTTSYSTAPLEVRPPSPNCTTNIQQEEDIEELPKCDIFDGKWVYDPKAYPLYHWHQCPLLDAQVNCRKNGRPDSDYEHWRWKPKGCELPRFNGTYMVESLRGKRVAIIGDSLNRNQWESLACLLYTWLDSSRVTVKVYGADMIFRALDYDFSLEFFWSPFLVMLDEMEDKAKVLKLDKLPSSAQKWVGADVMVFNTGHWWTHTGRIKPWKYFELKGKLMEEMESNAAFKIGLETWARWVDRKVNQAKTTVFFRSFSPEHKKPNHQWCYNQTHPMMTNETYIQWFPKSISSRIEQTIQRMETPVKFLNITRLSEFRRDAHTSVYTVRQLKLLTEEERKQPENFSDCSHWCLPGLPDTWNTLLYASLFGEPNILL